MYLLTGTQKSWNWGLTIWIILKSIKLLKNVKNCVNYFLSLKQKYIQFTITWEPKTYSIWNFGLINDFKNDWSWNELLTLIDDDSLHSLFELVGGSEAFHGSAQHPLLLRQPALQSGYLIFQQLILIWRINRLRSGLRGRLIRLGRYSVCVCARLPAGCCCRPLLCYRPAEKLSTPVWAADWPPPTRAACCSRCQINPSDAAPPSSVRVKTWVQPSVLLQSVSALQTKILNLPCCRSPAVWTCADTPAAGSPCSATASVHPRSACGGRCSPQSDPKYGARCDWPTSGGQAPGERERQWRCRPSCRWPTLRLPLSERDASPLKRLKHVMVI